MFHRQPEHAASLGYQIEILLQHIATTPAKLELHQSLRECALRYKAVGGRAAGMLEKVGASPSDPIKRMLRLEGLWSRDPGNLDYGPKLLAALEAVQQSAPAIDTMPVRRWLQKIIQEGHSGE